MRVSDRAPEWAETGLQGREGEPGSGRVAPRARPLATPERGETPKIERKLCERDRHLPRRVVILDVPIRSSAGHIIISPKGEGAAPRADNPEAALADRVPAPPIGSRLRRAPIK